MRSQCKQQGHTTRQGETEIKELYLLTNNLRMLQNLLQGHNSQQGYGEFGNHQNRRHSAELGIQRYVVDKKIGKGHEVFTPSQQYRQYRSRQQCPLHRPLDDKQSEHKKHQHKGTDINGAGCSGLLAPILRELAVNAGKLWVSFLHCRSISTH